MSAGSTITAPLCLQRRDRGVDEPVRRGAVAEESLARDADARAVQRLGIERLACSRLRACRRRAASPGRAGRRRSSPSSSAAASATVRVIGPAVSCVCEIGMMPERLTRPSVGLMPTRPLAVEGQTIEPSVSVPTPTPRGWRRSPRRCPSSTRTALRSSAYGFRTCPPRALQPLVDLVERKFAHSLSWSCRGSRRRPRAGAATTNASRAAIEPSSASDPAVVDHLVGGVDVVFDQDRDAVQRPASFPWSSAPRRARRRWMRASGLTSITDRSVGHWRSIASMRCRYRSTSRRDVYRPVAIASWSCATVISSSSNEGWSDLKGG